MALDPRSKKKNQNQNSSKIHRCDVVLNVFLVCTSLKFRNFMVTLLGEHFKYFTVIMCAFFCIQLKKDCTNRAVTQPSMPFKERRVLSFLILNF